MSKEDFLPREYGGPDIPVVITLFRINELYDAAKSISLSYTLYNAIKIF